MTFLPPTPKPTRRIPTIWFLVSGVIFGVIMIGWIGTILQVSSLSNEIDQIKRATLIEDRVVVIHATATSPVPEQTATPTLTATPRPTNIPTIIPTLTATLRPTNTLTPIHTPTPPPASTTQVELMGMIGTASFTVSLKPASVLNQANEITPTSTPVGSTPISITALPPSRCYPDGFNQTPPPPIVDESKAIPFELVFSGRGLATGAVTITLTTQGSFVMVKRGIDGGCVEATQHTDTGTIELGVATGVTRQQATVYYLVPDGTTTITIPPVFTVTATLQDGTVLSPLEGTSDQLRVLPLMYFADTASIRSEKSRDMNAIMRPINAKQRVRVIEIEGEGIDQWAQVEFDAKYGMSEHVGYINIGHQDVVETFIGSFEWVK